MAKAEGKISDLSLQAAGLTVSWGGAQSYKIDSNPKGQIKGDGPEAWFGPMQPIQPMAPPGTGGRQYDYPFGENLHYTPRGDGEITFQMLRNLADNLPLLRIVIEKRKDQIAGWEWDIQPILTAKDRRKSLPPGVGEDPRIATVRKFLRYPDRRHSFHTWMRMLLEDMLVTDAACVYPRKTRDGKLFSLDAIDGSTIKPLIGGDGRSPLPDDGPAYQQILHGVPASDFTIEELRYLPRNVRTNRLYGMSPVEQIVLTVNIALRREIYNLEYYNTGTLPDSFGTLPQDWTIDQVKQFQEYFDALMSGDLSRRRMLKFMPFGFTMKEVRSPPLKDTYDEWLARVVCAAFSVPPSPFVTDVNRATAQTIQIQASQEGIGPLQNWVKDWMDGFIQIDMGFDDLEFVWSGNDKTDPLVQAQCDASDVNCGIKSRDEIRVERGLDPFGIGPTVNGPITPLVEGYNQAVENIKNPPPVASPAAPAAGGKPAVAAKPLGAPKPPQAVSLNAKNDIRSKAGRGPKAGKAHQEPVVKSSVNAAGVMLQAPTGAVLFLLRAAKGGDAGGTWAFPGGGVEDGETDEQAVARECDEEIGFTPAIEDLGLAHTGSNGYRTFSAAIDGEFIPIINPEHDAYSWADPANPPRPLHPGVLETLINLGYLEDAN